MNPCLSLCLEGEWAVWDSECVNTVDARYNREDTKNKLCIKLVFLYAIPTSVCSNNVCCSQQCFLKASPNSDFPQSLNNAVDTWHVFVTTSCTLLVVLRVSACSRLDLHVFISARQSASRTCMHSDCTNSPPPATTLHKYRLWCEVTIGESGPYPTASHEVTE